MNLVKKGSGDSNKLQTVKEIENTKSKNENNRNFLFSPILN
jgi:hypothetical protein